MRADSLTGIVPDEEYQDIWSDLIFAWVAYADLGIYYRLLLPIS
jgi:hypothetical protein